MPRRFQPLTTALILLCTGWTAQIWFGRSYDEAGAAARQLLWEGEIWRLFTAIILHAGWVHLLVNMISLLFLGRWTEVVCGRGALVGFLLLSGLAGLAASLFAYPEAGWRVGISGGLFGLLAIIPAVEWARSKTLLEFLRQRNTIVVVIFLGINAALAVWVDRQFDVNVDHAAHIGGFVSGLVVAFAYYGRGERRVERRPRRAGFAAMLVCVLPVAYAVHPIFNYDFHRFRGDRAWQRNESDAAESSYAHALRLEPGQPHVGARLALLRDEPKLLATLDAPFGLERQVVWDAYFGLARRRFDRPEEALELLQRVREVAPPPTELWLSFAEEARQAEREEIALYCSERAAEELPESASWQEAWRVLALHGRRLSEEGLGPVEARSRAARAAGIARRAANGLAEESGLDDEARDALERDVAALATHVMRVTRGLLTMPEPPEGARAVAGQLRKLFERLAYNVEDERRAITYLHNSAVWWWTSLENPGGDDTDAVAARFGAVYRDAREFGLETVQTAAGAWLQRRGRPLPGADLAEPPGGG